MKSVSIPILLIYTYFSVLSVFALPSEKAEIQGSTFKNNSVRLVSNFLDSLSATNATLTYINQNIDSLRQQATLSQDKDVIAFLRFYDRIKKGFRTEHLENGIDIFDAATVYYENKHDYRYVAPGHFYKGQRHFELQQYGEAFYHHAKSLELFYKVGIENIPEIGKYLHIMALNHYYFHNYEKVIELMRVAVSYPAYNQNLDIQRYNTLGLAYQQIEQPDSAVYFFRQAQAVATTLNDSTWIHLSAGNLGRIYRKEGRYEEALPMLMGDFRQNQRLNRHPLLARNAAVEIAATWQELGRQDSVLRYLKESERMNAVVRNGEPMWKRQRDENFYISYLIK